jgi:hypothetical protein
MTMPMDNNTQVLASWITVCLSAVLIVLILCGGCQVENYLFIKSGFCQKPVLQNDPGHAAQDRVYQTMWVKCDAER